MSRIGKKGSDILSLRKELLALLGLLTFHEALWLLIVPFPNFLNRFLLGPIPFYLIFLRLYFGDKFYWNPNPKLWLYGCLATLVCATFFWDRLFMDFMFYGFNYGWIYGALFNWFFFLFAYLHTYGKKTLNVLDASILTALSLRCVGEVWELPAYVNKVFFVLVSHPYPAMKMLLVVATSFSIGLYAPVLLYLLTKVSPWERPKFFALAVFGAVSMYPIMFFSFQGANIHKAVSVMARTAWGLFFLIVAYGFQKPIELT